MLLDDPAPDFALENTAGETVRLSETLDSGPTVVLMNRGYWCSYCAEQMGTFSTLAYDLRRHLDIDILPIMGDPIPKLIEMRDLFEFRFQLLSDPDLEVARAYTGIEESANHGRIPIPGTFLVDTDGIVRYEQISKNPADRTYANYIRHLVNNDYEDPYPEPTFELDDA